MLHKSWNGLAGGFLAAGIMAAALAGCQSQSMTRGYIADPLALEQIKPGSSAEQVILVMGTPSTVSTVGGKAYYYISQQVSQRFQFMPKHITDQRVLYARRLLEETDLDIDWSAGQSGFGTATLLRHHFRRVIGVTPSDYRRKFACGTGGSICVTEESVATA